MDIADPYELASELGALAAGLCLDAGISLEVRGEQWSYDPLRRTLCVAEKSLRDHGRDWCAGRLVNEIGHYWLTRHDLFPLVLFEDTHAVPFPSEPVGRLAMDALDDARVNSWMTARYPGSRPWLDRVHATLDRPLAKPMPNVLRFCLECTLEPGRGWAPSPHPIPPQVAQALDQTREARRAYAEHLPSARVGETDPDVRRRWALSVRPAMNRMVWLPSAYEAETQIHALDALVLAIEEILPVVAELMADDLDQIERWLHQQPGEQGRLQQEIEQGRAQQAFQRACQAGRPSGGHPPNSRIRRLAQELLEALGSQGAAQQQQRLCGGEPIPGEPGGVGPSPWRDSPLELPPIPPTDYGRARLKVASQIDQLVRLLDRVLKPRQRLRTRSGYPSGRRVDLKRLMKFEADPRLYNELWVRSTIPERRRVVFSLLIDLSGSMSGEKSQAALLGTILMAETLAQLKVPFAVNGFQNVVIPFAPFHAHFGEALRRNIATMPQEVEEVRPGGNNHAGHNDDGPCVLQAANELLAEPADQRILIVVSDGQPAGLHSTEEDLRRTIRGLSSPGVPLELLGIGLGPNTQHVTDYYPRSVAEVPVSRFAHEIGTLIRRGLGV